MIGGLEMDNSILVNCIKEYNDRKYQRSIFIQAADALLNEADGRNVTREFYDYSHSLATMLLVQQKLLGFPCYKLNKEY